MKKSSKYNQKQKAASGKIEVYRKKIDKIDGKIIDLLGKRITLVLEVGKIKNSLHMPIRSAEREQKLMESLKLLAQKNKIPLQLIKKVYNQIFIYISAVTKRTKTTFDT